MSILLTVISEVITGCVAHLSVSVLATDRHRTEETIYSDTHEATVVGLGRITTAVASRKGGSILPTLLACTASFTLLSVCSDVTIRPTHDSYRSTPSVEERTLRVF